MKKETKKSVAIVNFDSLLFYKELNIGTAKPLLSEREEVPHYMVDVCSINNPMNASLFANEARKLINNLHKNETIPILVGGSGFYLRALLKGMYQCPSLPENLKIENQKLFQKEGITPFLNQLKKVDYKSYVNLHPNDTYRIMRAFEFYQVTKKPISEEKERLDSQDPYDFSKIEHLNWDIYQTYLNLPKSDHQQIIENRTQKMIEDGLVEEVKELLDKGATGTEKPLLSIGYKETIQLLQGIFDNQKAYQERINISTRQLAKAQRTFFKKVQHKNTFNPLHEIEIAVDQMVQFTLR